MRIYGDRVRTSKFIFVYTSPPPPPPPPPPPHPVGRGSTRGGGTAIKAGRSRESSVVVQATFHPPEWPGGEWRAEAAKGRWHRRIPRYQSPDMKQRIFICPAKREGRTRARKPDSASDSRYSARTHGQFSSRLLISNKNNPADILVNFPP